MWWFSVKVTLKEMLSNFLGLEVKDRIIKTMTQFLLLNYDLSMEPNAAYRLLDARMTDRLTLSMTYDLLWEPGPARDIS